MSAFTPTEEQLAAIMHREGPAYVTASPGAGKTAVVMRRIAHLISTGVDPNGIVGITFTNKAANVMKERICTLVDPRQAKRVWLSTFHSFCVQLLRASSKEYGVVRNFNIADESDAKEQVKIAAASVSGRSAQSLETNSDDIGFIRAWISNKKNQLLRPDDLDKHTVKFPENIKIYQEYQRRLDHDQLLDFDDLIMKVVLGIRRNPALQKFYNQNIQFLMVDEYQDTNFAQFELIRLLTQLRGNVFVIADDDQSIYKFRGAEAENTTRYYDAYATSKTYAAVVTYKLQRNFRSVPGIAKVANRLIKYNKRLHEKEIIPHKTGGEDPKYRGFNTVEDEARYIMGTIRDMVRSHRAEWRDFAVIYRIRSLSRVLEDVAVANNVPHRVVGSLAFYNRAAIKDVLAYARLLVNPKEDVSFARIYNKPRRGIGDVTFSAFSALAEKQDLRLLRALGARIYRSLPVMKTTMAGLDSLRDIFSELRKMDQTNVATILRKILKLTGYLHFAEAIKDQEHRERVLEDLHELVAAAEFYDEQYKGSKKASLRGFLEHAQLMQQEDQQEDKNVVMLMTAHAAKGMEFKNVFVVGCVEGIMPLYPRSDHGEILTQEIVRAHYEEERRVFYVAITRAEERLWMTLPRTRRDYKDGPALSTPSRFLYEALGSDLQLDQAPSMKTPETITPSSRTILKRNNQRVTIDTTGGVNEIIQSRSRSQLSSRPSQEDLQATKRERLRRLAVRGSEKTGATKPTH